MDKAPSHEEEMTANHNNENDDDNDGDPTMMIVSTTTSNEKLVDDVTSTHKDKDDKEALSSSSNKKKQKKRQRYILLFFAYAYTFLFAGAFFGWGPMQLLLEQNGSFSSKCTATEQQEGIICNAQSAALVQVHFTAILSQFVSPFLGELVDRYGPAFLSYCMAACGCTGAALLVVAAVVDGADWILYAAFVAIAFATWMGGLLTVRVGMVFQGRLRERVIFIINSLFDAGSITYLGLWVLAKSFGWSLTAVASLYLGMAVVVFGGAAYYWTIVEPESEVKGDAVDEDEDDYNNTKFATIDQTAGTSKVNSDLSTRNNTVTRQGEEDDDVEIEFKSDPDHKPAGSEEQNEAKGRTGEVAHHDVNTQDSDYVLVADRTQIQQIFSGPYLLALSFTTMMITANQWTLTTTRDFLATLGDDEVDNKYLTIFTLLFPASLAALPCTDFIYSKYGFHGAFQAINALALGYSLVRLLSDDLNVQILGFLLFSFFRCFLFGVTFSALPMFLSPDVVGKAMGITYAVAGVFSYVNIPLSTLAIETKDGDFFIPNLIYTVLVFPCVFVSWGLANAIEKESRIKRQRWNEK